MTEKIKAAALLAAAIAIPSEGLRQYAYRDPVGILTVCYGETHNVQAGRKYSLQECIGMLDESMAKAVKQVDQCVPGLPVETLAAFSDAVFNMGPTIACDKKRSTAARKLAAGDWKGACNELPKWDKAKVGGFLISLPGLTNRRKKEQELCLKNL